MNFDEVDEKDREGQEVLAELARLVEETKANAKNAKVKAHKLDEIRSRLKRGKEVVRDFKVELRCIGAQSQSEYKKKVTDLEAELNRYTAELQFLEKDDLTDGAASAPVTTTAVLSKAEAIQKEDLGIVNDLDAKLNITTDTAVNTLAKMHTQSEQLEHIQELTDEMQDQMKLARAQLRQFTRRMMTDKLILVFIGLIFCGIVVAVAYAIAKPKLDDIDWTNFIPDIFGSDGNSTSSSSTP
ncbi:SNARE-family protein [Pelomyxa schiedti]|nr:SNARE-family protein [Pelomyxa schiedti]